VPGTLWALPGARSRLTTRLLIEMTPGLPAEVQPGRFEVPPSSEDKVADHQRGRRDGRGTDHWMGDRALRPSSGAPASSVRSSPETS
jgi:hypothetical protein